MSESILRKLSGSKVLRKCLGKPFLRVSEWVWNSLPVPMRSLRPVIAYGSFLNLLVRLRSDRTQYHGTFFFRNRPELELIRKLSTQWASDSALKMTVLACSNGAEVYSILWTIRSARPDLKVDVHAIDISSQIVDIAEKGEYSLQTDRLVGSPIFERMTDEEMRQMFEQVEGRMKIRPWIKERVHWEVGDARDPHLATLLVGQDIVVANKFLCHMTPPDAEECLRNIAQLVRPGGYLFVSGVDLDVRTKVARELGWAPVPDLLEEIHDGDQSVRKDWPWRYWGLEPLDQKKDDWKLRYASVFQVGKPAPDRTYEIGSPKQVFCAL